MQAKAILGQHLAHDLLLGSRFQTNVEEVRACNLNILPQLLLHQQTGIEFEALGLLHGRVDGKVVHCHSAQFKSGQIARTLHEPSMAGLKAASNSYLTWI
jgi:hypothetical protein